MQEQCDKLRTPFTNPGFVVAVLLWRGVGAQGEVRGIPSLPHGRGSARGQQNATSGLFLFVSIRG